MNLHALLALSVASIALSGCLSDDTAPTTVDPVVDDALDLVESTFVANVIDVAVHQGHGLYEPTIDVGMDGAIYVSAHSTGVGVLPAPGYVSTDDGASWQNLALLGPAQNPGPGQTAAPLFSDEIFIVAGDEGQAWGVDINLRDFIIAGWCDDGADNCYQNPSAYDHSKTVTQAGDCTPTPLKDRPWAAYSNGTLFIVNNPGGGPAQIAAMQVPPAVPVDAGHVAADIQWNLCASSGGWIPGIPDLREDGFFAMPQLQGDHYILVTGYTDDVMAVTETVVFNNTHTSPAESDSTPSEVGPYGQAVFDGEGTLFVGAMNNTAGAARGGIHVAYSMDDSASFIDATFRFDQPVSSVYFDGNKNGSGALVNWGQIDGADTDWYFGHVIVNESGELELVNVMLAVDDGPEASRHIQGAALGPDGRAYMVMSEVSGNDDQAMAAAIGSTPMSVVVQQDGPVLG